MQTSTSMSIQKATAPKKSDDLIKKQEVRDCNEKIVFSYELTDSTNEYFNLHDTCVKWANDLFDVLKNVSSYTENDLRSGKYSKSTIRFHSHDNGNAAFEPPIGISPDDFYQIRISQSKGGIHGVFVENVFYIVWFDPLHNMYPNENYGGLRKIKPPDSCCKDRDEELIKLKKENEELYSLLDTKTSPL